MKKNKKSAKKCTFFVVAASLRLCTFGGWCHFMRLSTFGGVLQAIHLVCFFCFLAKELDQFFGFSYANVGAMCT